MTQEPSEELTTIASVRDATLVDAMRVALDAEGIPCTVEGEHQAGLAGILPMRIIVRSEDAERAREILGV